MHVLKSFGEILASVVVETQVRITISNNRTIIPKKFLLNNDGFCLQLNCLQVVPKLVLDVSHLCDTGGDLWVHWSGDLHKYVYGLAVIIKGLLKMAFTLCGPSLLHQDGRVFVLDVDVFQNWVKI